MTARGPDTGRDLEALPAAYQAWRRSALGQVTDALEQDLILDLVGPPAGRRILDVGCGDGILALDLARRGAVVAGVDASQRMIAAARERARGQHCDVSFEAGRAEALPFAAASFDVVVAVTVLCFVDDAMVALKEMTRILKPGGRLVVGELGRYSSWAAMRRIKGWLGSSVWRRAQFRSRSELERLAKGAGLGKVSVTGAVFYPPIGISARLFRPLDRRLGQVTTLGAALLVLVATKPAEPAEQGGSCP